MRLLTALAVLLAAPAAASAAPPWSEPVTVAEGGVVSPAVLSTPAGSAVLWYGAPGSAGGLLTPTSEIFAAPLDAAGAPQPPRRVARRIGALAAGRRFTFAAVAGRRLLAGSAGAPGAPFAVRRVARAPRGSAAAVAAGSAVAYAVRPTGHPRREHVMLSRLAGARFTRARRISPRGRVRSLTMAANARGDILAAWQRGRAIEARIVTARGVRSPVRRIARAFYAMRVDAALGADGTAAVAWVDQYVSEGEAFDPATIRAAVRPAGGRFGRARLLEEYPDREIAAGAGARVAIAGGRPVVVWNGRRAIRAAFAAGTRFGPPQDLGPLGDRTYDRAGGLADLAALPGGRALAVWVAPLDPSGAQVLAAPLAAAAPAFGPPEAVGEPGQLVTGASAGLDPAGRAVVAWGASGSAANRILLANRPLP